MADDHDDAGPVVEELLERAQGVEVEIVRRLVEQQDVGLLEQGEQQLQAPALAARECADRRELRVAVEPELAHQLHVVERGLVLVAGDGVAHTLVHVEVAAELVVVADLDRAPDLDRALRGLQPAGDEIEQRALAGAVGADDADAIARLEHVVERLQDEQRSASSPTVARASGHEKPTPWISTPFDPNRVLPSASPSSPSRALASGPRARSAFAVSMRALGFDVRAGAPASQPRELASREVLARLLLRRGVRLALGARREVCRVSGSSRPFLRNVQVVRAAVDLEHLVGDAVEHVAVVRHEEQAARERGQPLLEVGDGVEIEVVGRFVEDEGVPVASEQRGERDPLLLPARELVGRRVEQAAHAEARKHRLALPLLTIEAVAHRGAHGAGRQHGELGAARRPARCGRGARCPLRARGRRSSWRAACSCRSR